jgi:hypothetical protein
MIGFYAYIAWKSACVSDFCVKKKKIFSLRMIFLHSKTNENPAQNT